MTPWYKSKTLWFGILYGIVQIAGLFGFADYTPSSDVSEIVGVVVSVVVLVLRFVTDSGIKGVTNKLIKKPRG